MFRKKTLQYKIIKTAKKYVYHIRFCRFKSNTFSSEMSYLKDALAGLTKFFSGNKVVLILIFLAVAVGLMYASNTPVTFKPPMGREGMDSYAASSALSPSDLGTDNSIMIPSSSSVPDGSNPVQGGGGYTALDSANPTDLLPNDVNNAWSQLNPSSQGDIKNPDLLQAGYLIGLDTIGQTLRIPNLQLRADPIIPKQNVGPWNQAPDVDPDYGRVPLDAGCAR